jgi:hypothetical protein
MQNRYTTTDVNVTGIDVPFWDLVWLLVKVTIAWIPAFIMLCLLAFGAAVVAMMFFGVGLSFMEGWVS